MCEVRAKPDATMSGVDALLGVLSGSGLTRAGAERLILDAGGSVETAVALYFSSNQSSSARDQQSPVAQLQAVLGPILQLSQANELLRRTNNSVSLAIDLYYSQQGAAAGGTSSAEGAAQGAGSSEEAIALPESAEASAEDVDPDPAEAGPSVPALQQGLAAESAGPSSGNQALRRPRTGTGRRRDAAMRGGGARRQANSNRAAARSGAGGSRSDAMWSPPNAAHLAFLAGVGPEGTGLTATQNGRRRPRPPRRSAGRRPRALEQFSGPSDDDDSNSDTDVNSATLAAEIEGGDEGDQSEQMEENAGNQDQPLERDIIQNGIDIKRFTVETAKLLHNKEEHQAKKCKGLPAPKKRNRNGRLFSAKPEGVPASFPGKEPQNLSMKLGTFTFPMVPYNMEKDGKIATAILEGRAQLVDGEITVVLQDNPTDMAESYVSSALTDEDEELCAWPDNMADIQILSFIETLRLNGTVDIVYTMAVDKNKPEDTEERMERGRRGRKKKRARKGKGANAAQIWLAADITLLHIASAAFFSSDPSASKLTHTQKTASGHLCSLVLLMLARGSGLWLGPDSDGLLNFCDPTGAATAMERAAKAGKGKAPADAAAPEQGTSEDGARGITRKDQTELDRLLTCGALPRDAPLAAAPPSLQSHPKRFQLQGLQWMLDRELKGDAVGRGHLHLHPAWLQVVNAANQIIYVNSLERLVSLDFVTAPVGGTCGGFLCDVMGLGKTLETLMLILANPAPVGWAVTDLEKHIRARQEDPLPVKSTLIVMPANLLGQWQDELDTHVAEGALTWGIYGGQEGGISISGPGDTGTSDGRSTRIRTKGNHSNGSYSVMGFTALRCQGPDGLVPLHECDVVFMTYEQLRKELGYADKSLLLQYGFWRVVLDEAQLVASSSSAAAVMCSAIWRRTAWVVTGTPISNKIEEIQGLLEFLAYEPFYDNRSWNQVVLRKHESGLERLLPLCSLLKGVMLRRTKQDVEGELELPPCSHVDRWVELSPVERTIYERSRTALETAVQNAGLKRRKGAQATKPVTGKLMRSFTELRQQCCHPQIVRRDMWLGKTRLSMRQILTRLVLRAFTDYDIALRQEYVARLLLAAVLISDQHEDATFEQVLREIELGSELAGAADVQELLTKREADGGLPPINPAAPHPFRGSGPGHHLHEPMPSSPGGKRKAEGAADVSGKSPEKRSRQEAEDTREAAAASVEAQDDRDSAGGVRVPVIAGLSTAVSLAEETPADTRPSTPAMPFSSAASSFAGEKPLENGSCAVAGPSAVASAGKARATSAGASAGSSLTVKAPLENGPMAAGPASSGHVPLNGHDAAQAGPSGQPHDRSSAPQPSSDQAATIPNGPSAEEKGKGKAVDANNPIGPMDELAQQAEKAARERYRSWQRLRLEGLMLLQDVLSSAEGKLKRSCTDNPVKASQLVNLQDDLQQVGAASDTLRALLGDEVAPGQQAAAMRFSRRQRGMEIDQDLAADEELDLQVERAAQQRAAQQILRSYSQLMSKVDPVKAAQRGLDSSSAATREKWHHLQHLQHKLDSLDKAKDGPSAIGPDDAGPSNGAVTQQGQDQEQDDGADCPICFDVCERRTLTSCGHHFCSDCIHEAVHNRAECPICRTPLKPSDLFDAATDEEEETARLMHENVGNYGAKVTALLVELAEMRRQDPGAKAVVFSTWGRLLKLVGEALQANGLQHVSLAGAQPNSRAAALRRFLTDPDCAVILIVLSTGGGAAGLTLTVANAVFLMEPALNPGLEAQAAARIHRLGQTKMTQVVRLLAEGTIEASILKLQERKLSTGDDVEDDASLARNDVDASTLMGLMKDHPEPVPAAS